MYGGVVMSLQSKKGDGGNYDITPVPFSYPRPLFLATSPFLSHESDG